MPGILGIHRVQRKRQAVIDKYALGSMIMCLAVSMSLRLAVSMIMCFAVSMTMCLVLIDGMLCSQFTLFADGS